MPCKARNQPCFPWGYTHWATAQICANLNLANLTQVEGWCPSMALVDRCAVGLVEIVWCQILVRAIQQKVQMVVVWCCNDKFGVWIWSSEDVWSFLCRSVQAGAKPNPARSLEHLATTGVLSIRDRDIGSTWAALATWCQFVRQKSLQYFGKGLGAQQPLQLPGQDSISLFF